MAKKYLVVDKWYGGVSTGSRSGPTGSFAKETVKLDFRSDPDYLSLNNYLEKKSENVVTDMVKWMTSYGETVFAIGDTGKIYYGDVGVVWDLRRTVANCKGQGLAFYGDYLYYRQNSQIGRYGPMTGGAAFTDAWKTGADNVQTVTDWGTIQPFLDFVAFANGRYLATWNDSTFTYNRLSWPTNYFIQDIGAMAEYLAIAVNNDYDMSLATRSWLFFWDGTSQTYNFHVEIPEPIISIQTTADKVTIFTPSGNIYEYNGTLTKVKKLPGVGSNKTVHVYPGAACNKDGLCYFGLAGGTSTMSHYIGSWGRIDSNYPSALGYDYEVTAGTASTVYISALFARGPYVWAAWKSGSTYGIDRLQTSYCYDESYYYSLAVSFPRPIKVTRAKLFFKPLTTDQSIGFGYRTDQDSMFTTEYASFSTIGAEATTYLFNTEFSGEEFEFCLYLGTNSGISPSISKVVIEYEEDGTL